MIRIRTTILGLSCAVLSAATSMAQEPRVFEENGIRYQETTQVIQRLVPETRYEQRENTVYRERVTTDLQNSVRTYQVPVTEQQWVPGYDRWNIFRPPVLSYRLMPVTRWETRTETIRVPVTKREYVAEKQVQQVPITNTHLAEERIVRRVPIGTVAHGTVMNATPGSSTDAASVARSNSDFVGGTSLESDPPRDTASPIDRRR
jgi:hypothetical protein